MSDKFPFPDGDACTLEEIVRRNLLVHQIKIDEGERGMILLALAELSIARPGWVQALEEIAIKMDNKDENGHSEMFERFRQLHTLPMREALVR